MQTCCVSALLLNYGIYNSDTLDHMKIIGYTVYIQLIHIQYIIQIHYYECIIYI